MALPDFAKIEQGSIFTWQASGGDGVLNLDGLVNGEARQGDKFDRGATFDDELGLLLVGQPTSAPTAGRGLNLYIASSHDGATWPGKVTGNDAAWPGGALTLADWVGQLSSAKVRLVIGPEASQQIQLAVIIRPTFRWIAPVVHNDLGVNLSSTTNTSKVLLVPRRLLVQDAA